jgi:peroxiredoxin
MKRVLFAACLLASAPGCFLLGPPNSAQQSAPGGMATEFSAKDVEGRTFHLAEHLGKKAVLLDFWATFCQPCQAEFPHLRRLYDEYRAQGFVVVAVSMDGPETIAEVPSFVSRNGINFPVVLDEDSRIAALYNPRKSAPLTILIDKEGRIAKVREGFNPGDGALLESEVRTVLGNTP